MAYPARPPLVRFWEKVDRSGGEDACWIWTASRLKHGYGCFRFKRPGTPAHRAAYELLVGPIPDGQCVCHRCDNPPCVNPGHLFLATSVENTKDRHAKGRDARGPTSGRVTRPERTARGEQHGAAKLTLAQVEEIRRRHREGDGTTYSLGREYGLNPCTIGRIIGGRTWRDAPETSTPPHPIE